MYGQASHLSRNGHAIPRKLGPLAPAPAPAPAASSVEGWGETMAKPGAGTVVDVSMEDAETLDTALMDMDDEALAQLLADDDLVQSDPIPRNALAPAGHPLDPGGAQEDSRDGSIAMATDTASDLQRLLRQAVEDRERYKKIAETAQAEVQSARGENLYLRSKVDDEQRRTQALRREQEQRQAEIRSTQSDQQARLQDELKNLKAQLSFRDREVAELEAKLREVKRATRSTAPPPIPVQQPPASHPGNVPPSRTQPPASHSGHALPATTQMAVREASIVRIEAPFVHKRLLSSIVEAGDGSPGPLTSFMSIDEMGSAETGLHHPASVWGSRGVHEPGLGALVNAVYASEGSPAEKASVARAVVQALQTTRAAEVLPCVARALDFLLEASVPDELAISIAICAVRAALPGQPTSKPSSRVIIGGQSVGERKDGSFNALPIDESLVRTLLRLVVRPETSEGAVVGALDCLAIALPQTNEHAFMYEYLGEVIRTALQDAVKPDNAGRVTRALVVGSLVLGQCAGIDLHGGHRCVIDMSCDPCHIPPDSLQIVQLHASFVRFVATATGTQGSRFLETQCACVQRVVGGLLTLMDGYVDALTCNGRRPWGLAEGPGVVAMVTVVTEALALLHQICAKLRDFKARVGPSKNLYWVACAKLNNLLHMWSLSSTMDNVAEVPLGEQQLADCEVQAQDLVDWLDQEIP